MRTKTTLTWIAMLFLIACSSSRGTVTVTPDEHDAVAMLSRQGTDAVMWQYSSAEAYLLFVQGYQLARIRLQENLERSDGRKPAVIVDIDETVLDNSPYEVFLIHNELMYDPLTWKAWTDKAAAKAIPGSREFLLHAAGLGCEVYYITNRDTSERTSTLKNLSALGFPFADDGHLLLMQGNSDKTERRAIVSRDHQVMLLVGDQLRDFDEIFKDRSVDHGREHVRMMADTLQRYFIMLPNPMYGTYRDAIQGKGTPQEKQERVRSFFRENSY